MNRKIHITSLLSFLMYFCLAMVGIQCENYPQIFVFILLLTCGIGMLTVKNIRFHLELFVLIITFTVYFFISNQNVSSSYTYATNWLAPIAGYICGYLLIAKSRRADIYHRFYKAIAIITVSTTTFSVACIIYKFANIEIYNNKIALAKVYYTMTERYGLNLWNNELIQPTNLNSFCIFPILLMVFCLTYLNDKKWKVIYWILFGASITVALVTATRTNLMMIPISLVIGFFYSRKDIKRKITKSTVIRIMLLILLLLFASNWIISWLENSLLSGRTETLDNGRINSIKRVLLLIPAYPLGSMPVTYAHNMWVDVARIAGVIPMIGLIIYTLFIIRTLERLQKNPHICRATKSLICTLTVGLLISFSIEPVIAGRPFNFMFFCVINGMCAAFARINYNATENVL